MVGAWVASAVAAAGYGDAFDGLPSHEDRETFLWTNAVRAAPEAFQGAYPCAFSGFAASERTPKPLLKLDEGLAAAASYHSHDMQQDDYFDHDSNDGTPWNVRVNRYYDGGTIGENIAWGYDSPYSVVVEGWMCSSGHRANLMSGSFNELGTGVAGPYFTQDFGRGDAPERAMAIGVHVPEQPRQEVELFVDHDATAPPDEVYAVVNGARVDLALAVGTPERGVYGGVAPVGEGCQAYYFVAVSGGRTETWPQSGSYGWGDCAWDDAGAAWLEGQLPLEGGEATEPGGTEPGGTEPGGADTGLPGDTGLGGAEDDPSSPESAGASLAACGCATPGPLPALPGLIALLALRRARRR